MRCFRWHSDLIHFVSFFRYKTLDFNDYVSGAKYCIELIAVYAANQEEGMQTRSYLRSFQRFIKYMQNFDNLNIHFERNEGQVLDKNRPRVIDPVNPYNNLTKNWDPKSIQLIKDYAIESNRRLQALANGGPARLEVLFEPQPVYSLDMRQIYKYGQTERSQWLVSTDTFSLLPDLKIRNEKFHTDDQLWIFLDLLKKYIQMTVFASNASSCDENYTKEAVGNTIAKQVCNTKLSWCSRNDQHEDYDVTFTVPFSNQKAIRISFRQ